MTNLQERIYSSEYIMKYRHDYNPRDIPNEIRNFKVFLTKCPQLASSLKLVTEDDEIIKLSSSLIDPTAEVLRKLTGVLNRMTDSNYDSEMLEIKKFNRLPNDSVTTSIMDVLMNNVKKSHEFIKLYAQMTKDVDTLKVWQTGNASFSKEISKKFLKEFDKFQNLQIRQTLQADLAKISDPDDRNDTEAKIKRENKAVILFLAHLFVRDILPNSKLSTILDKLLRPIPGSLDLDEYNLDFFLVMYPICFEKHKSTQPKESTDTINQVKSFVDTSEYSLSFRLKFMISDFLKTLSAKNKDSAPSSRSVENSSHRKSAAVSRWRP